MSSTVGAIDRSQHAADDDGALRQLSTAFALTLLGLIAALAIVLAARRLSGALISPLSGGELLLTALTLELALVLCRRIGLRTKYSVLSTQYFGALPHFVPPPNLAIPSLAALIIVASLTIRGTPAWSLILAWLILIAAESLQWLVHYRPTFLTLRWLNQLRPLAHRAAEHELPEVPRGLVQQLTRTLEANQESIHVLVRAEIAARDRIGVVHLSFCPPLSAPPRISAHAIDADEADVRTTQAETFGARLEVRLPTAADSSRTVMIEVLGSAQVDAVHRPKITAHPVASAPPQQAAAPADQGLA